MMRAAIAAKDWELAEQYSTQALIEQPNDPEIMTLAAGVAAFRDRKRDAATLLADAARISDFARGRVDTAIRGLIDVGEIYAAIDLLEESLERFPDRSDHRQVLVGFYNEVQRTEEIPKHFARLIRDRHFSLPLLLSITETSSRRLSEKSAERLLERNPGDLRVRLVDAYLKLYRSQAAAAADILEQVLRQQPDFAPAHAMYGQALVLTNQWARIPDWYRSAPTGSSSFADHWLTLGDYASRSEQLPEAVRAYWEATQKEPTKSLAWDRLRLAIDRLRQSESPMAAEITEDHVRVISKHNARVHALRDSFNDFSGSETQERVKEESQAKAARVARELVALGRVWEAEAWSAIASTLKKDPDASLPELRRQILARLQEDSSWIARRTPAMKIDYSTLPLPKIETLSEAGNGGMLVPNLPTHDHVRITERGKDWGVGTIGDGNDPSDPWVAPLIRSTGAGGGSIDYDLDGMADMVVVNAGGTMLANDSLANDLLRNLGSRFVEVSDAAGVNGTRYGQGLAVGDFNEDGFPDLFIANLGSNQLLRNNGDGTFSDCSELLDDQGPEQWSTSAAFVDADGDSIADLILTQYCAAVDHLDKPCPDSEGESGPCHPMTFAGDTDQFFRGGGDGSLKDVTAQWVGEPVAGRGLGLVVGALDNRQFGAFVANDMTRNSFYSSGGGEQARRFIDSATARGVAVDGRSQTQASMGVAASDFDQDGDLDLYVTGFGREYNIYYEQVVPGVWKDETAKMQLIEPTLLFVGFGAQAIDLDNDGIDEILVTNGNIGKFKTPGADRYEQPFQLFRRTADGTFELVDDDPWGSYFRTDHVGRTLWTTDVNRDGRMDAVVTHTREPIGLLINETESTSHCVGFQLIATQASRDAVGAIIRFRVNGKPRTLWRLAGDGYFCSNEKTLLAGLGENNEITDVVVTWPNGRREEIGTLSADMRYALIEGQGAFELDRYPLASGDNPSVRDR
ncbi:MAG: FG-GAP-like repeat-containing protein [Planctomycetota bacterium]